MNYNGGSRESSVGKKKLKGDEKSLASAKAAKSKKGRGGRGKKGAAAQAGPTEEEVMEKRLNDAVMMEESMRTTSYVGDVKDRAGAEGVKTVAQVGPLRLPHSSWSAWTPPS